MNLDPALLDDHRLPRLPRRRWPSTRTASELVCTALRAAPTRSATTSRCCWSTRPAAPSRR